ncbi:N-acetylglucosaminyltransferase [Ramlibacter sp. USB13]|uniref:N-acetylglucosaminyltransferase n=1 Tax=Ramlibacter cellulosilyticus TaxID=2764187 RepID=A0A923MRG8_9BURK|nr:GlcNAc-transferase family protein [Ramlibacter cellulosilyticus]MBC5782854.1 N-acetylglucosaminyltransferase [Ramlibacter cellulosilyticus]
MRIFVSIASYCDPVLSFTLERAVAAAADDSRLHFGVVDQSPAGSPRVAAPGRARLSLVQVDARDARGPCWARALAMSLHDGEDWFLQLDSHMDFDPGWDDTLVAQALALGGPRRPVAISSYPDAFTFVDGAAVRRPTTTGVLAQVLKPDAAFAPDHPVLGFQAQPVESSEPLPAFHVGAGCLFAPGRIVREVPYDPWLYFHGEEQAMALRLYTHGWDLFHMPGLPVHHLYNDANSGGPPRPLHWDAQQEAERALPWWQLEQRSRERLAALVDGADLGIYGLGRVRSVADFAAFSGIDYAARTLAAAAFAPRA